MDAIEKLLNFAEQHWGVSGRRVTATSLPIVALLSYWAIQTQIGRDGKTQISPASETDSGHLDRSHSHQQERLSRRSAGSLWASGNPIQTD
jgi:hypothetical protein